MYNEPACTLAELYEWLSIFWWAHIHSKGVNTTNAKQETVDAIRLLKAVLNHTEGPTCDMSERQWRVVADNLMTNSRWHLIRKHFCFIDMQPAAAAASHRDDTSKIEKMKETLNMMFNPSLQIFATHYGRISLDDDLIGTLSQSNPKHTRKQNKVKSFFYFYIAKLVVYLCFTSIRHVHNPVQADQNGFNTTNIACSYTRASMFKLPSQNEFSQDKDAIELLERYRCANRTNVSCCIVNCDRGFPSEKLQDYFKTSGFGFECILPNHRQVPARDNFNYTL